MTLMNLSGRVLTEECIKGKFPASSLGYASSRSNSSSSRTVPKGHLVAIKVLDIDNADYKSIRDLKDESIKDFIQETKVMKQVKDSGAVNVNMIVEAISIHSQLWLVCEYCPGGSVKTLVGSPFRFVENSLADVSFCGMTMRLGTAFITVMRNSPSPWLSSLSYHH